MYRRNIYDILSEMDIDVAKEYKKLFSLFFEESSVPMTGYLRPLVQYVDEIYFRDLPCRGSFVSVKEMFSALNLSDTSNKLEDLFLLCEFFVALLPESRLEENSHLRKQAKVIIGNIFYILEKTNYELFDLEGKGWIIVEKNKYAKEAALIVESPEIAIKLIEYNHFALKGNLEKKRSIILSIADYMEPMLKSRVLERAGYRQLQSDLGFLFNNFHIRHNNKEGAKAQEYICTLTDSQIEVWYDRIYNSSLAGLIMNEHISVQSELEELKQKYTWKT